MKKLINKLFLSVLSLTLAISLVGTVVYAWFSISTLNILHNVTLGIAADDGFEISLDGINYFKEIKSEEINKYINNNLQLLDVTSVDGINFFKGGPSNYVGAIENIDYLKLTVHFRTTAKATASPETVLRNVFLVDNVSSAAYLDKDIDGTYVISKGINWRSDVTFINGLDPINDIVYVGDRHVMYGAEAIRIGFVEQKLSHEFDERNDGELVNKIFDLSRNPERGYGTSYGSLDYYNEKNKSNFEPPSTNQEVITTLTEFNEFDPRFTNDEVSLITSMIKTNKFTDKGEVYFEGKVDISIWLEGWDADCFDAIYRDKITIRLKFRSARGTIDTI